MIDTGAASSVDRPESGAARRPGARRPGVSPASDSGRRRQPARGGLEYQLRHVPDRRRIVRNAAGQRDRLATGQVDILLGADFLRSHRVLFAMSQQKIYLSYIGGAPFGQRRKLEPGCCRGSRSRQSRCPVLRWPTWLSSRQAARRAGCGAGRRLARKSGAPAGNPHANMMLRPLAVQHGAHRAGRARLRLRPTSCRPTARRPCGCISRALRSKQADLARTELMANRARSQDKVPGRRPSPISISARSRPTACWRRPRASRRQNRAKTTCDRLHCRCRTGMRRAATARRPSAAPQGRRSQRQAAPKTAGTSGRGRRLRSARATMTATSLFLPTSPCSRPLRTTCAAFSAKPGASSAPAKS